MDGSESICGDDPTFNIEQNSCNNWRQVQSFIAYAVRELNIGSENARVAVITFADEGTIQWNLHQYVEPMPVYSKRQCISRYAFERQLLA